MRGENLPASTARTLSSKETSIARAYGLFKIHKTGNSLRMIVSLVGCPTYNLSKWMFNRFKLIVADSEHSIFTSLEFPECIKHISIAPDECMLSFDVVSLFTSISLGLARYTIILILDDHGLGLPPAETIDLLYHCLSNYFQFDSCFYQQIRGTPMGSLISGLIAEAVLQGLERAVFVVISPKFWKCSVDDTFVIIKQGDFSAFHHLLNTTLTGIGFTMETAAENKLLSWMS